VAIATYNRAAMVREAIAAALGQSRPPDEIVVSDDASTDATPAALEEIANGNRAVRVLSQSRNSGGVPNWNYAIEATTGDYIAWCSDDDQFAPGHLETSVAFLDAHPGVGLVHSGFSDLVDMRPNIRETIPRRPRSTKPLFLRPHQLLRYMTRYYDWPFHPSTIVMRRKVWDRVGPFHAQYALADTDWFVRAAEQFTVALLPRCGVLNRRHAGNWSNRLGSARMQGEIFEIVEAAIDRRWPHGSARKTLWRAVWRSNVRLRLLLTIRARVRGRNPDAAVAAWLAFARKTGRRMPGWLERWGSERIRAAAASRSVRFADPRQSVSPL